MNEIEFQERIVQVLADQSASMNALVELVRDLTERVAKLERQLAGKSTLRVMR